MNKILILVLFAIALEFIAYNVDWYRVKLQDKKNAKKQLDNVVYECKILNDLYAPTGYPATKDEIKMAINKEETK